MLGARGLAEDAACRVHSIELGCKGEPCKTAIQVVLSAPRRTLVIEIETVTSPGVTDEVMDSTEPVECATEFTAQQRMEPLSNGHGRGDLQNSVPAYRTD